jgi:hypothetical protein
MKKLFISALLGVSVITASANSVTTVLNPGVFTNLLSGFNQSVLVKQVVISANSTNAAAQLIDSPTNTLTYVNAAYTNTISYATNYVSSWTNYYGVTQSYTNLQLVDVSNPVAASTNSYPVRMGVACLAGSTATYGNVNYYFNRGIWATNTSTGIATITIVY